MKYFINALILVIFLTTSILFSQAQEKQTVKKEIKIEKVEKKDNCSTKDKSSSKQESCDTKKSSAKTEEACCSDEAKAEDDSCKTEKSSKVKESKN